MDRNILVFQRSTLLILSGALAYALATHFFYFYQMELPERAGAALVMFIFTGLVYCFFASRWARLWPFLKTRRWISLSAMGLTLLTLVLIWVKGFNPLMPLLPDHVLTLRWEKQADSSPLKVSDMRLSWGSSIYTDSVQVGGPYSIQYGVILMEGPENRIVFDRWREDGIHLQLWQIDNKKIQAFWDGLPVQIGTGNLDGQVNLPSYQWANSIWYKRAFFIIGNGADYLVEAGVLFGFFFLLLVLLTKKEAELLFQNRMVTGMLWVYLGLAVQRAWINDDAYITFRTVDNFIHGYGLTWNVTERVQAYTHPLWMLLLSMFDFFTHQIYATSLVLSLGLSFAGVYLLAKKMALSQIAAVLAVLVLSFSSAFVDYSTSGLENPLSYFLLALFLLIYFRKSAKNKLFWLSFVASLALCNRMDTGIFYIFPIMYEFLRERSWRSLARVITGQTPFIAWEIFSIVYYGFPFPNTAYAKLSAAIPDLLYYQWSLSYYHFTLAYDPITIFGILCGLGAAVYKKEWRTWAVAAGIPFYLLYLVRIGGDFMGGRYFALPLFCAMLLVSRIPLRVMSLSRASGLPALVFVIIFQAYYVTPIVGNIFHKDPTQMEKGVSDERLQYAENSGLVYLIDKAFERVMLQNWQAIKWPDTNWGADGERMKRLAETSQQSVFISGNIGYKGFNAGPKVYIIDMYALPEPLLARLPVLTDAKEHVGHLLRPVPEGYVETIETDRNHLKDPKLALFYDQLSLITRGDLFDPARLNAIWNMNLGRYNHLIDTAYYSRIAALEEMLPEKY